MKKILTTVGFFAVVSAGSALAGEDCLVPMADWQPREAVAQLAAENGWIVRRIKIDDGCYEIDASDAEGRRIEVTVEPGTLEVLEFEFKDETHQSRRRFKGRTGD